jgi:hypothetical protein
MRPILTAGIALGVLVAIWTFFMGFTGWYKDPGLAILFVPVAIFINVGLIVWGLMQTARQGRRYWSQVGAGVLIGVVGAVIIFGGSLLFTTVAFPEYFEEIRVMHAEMLRAAGQTEPEIEARLELAAKAQTPVINAVTGVVGTLMTSLVAALLTAAFVRST